VQPYLISWFKLDPEAIIKKLSGPVLIIQGTKDLQVPIFYGERLHKACKQSSYVLVENMNHILTEISADNQQANMESYNKPELPLSKKMLDEISAFIKR
jgi:Hydrolases of the alpha/beta superfamily